jgi:CheY-like chemotaxis protein
VRWFATLFPFKTTVVAISDRTQRDSDITLAGDPSGGVTPNRAFARAVPRRSATATGKHAKGRRKTATQKILVVDDVADVTEMIALFLRHAGFEVTTANSANKALQLTTEAQFDLIISDIGMPEMNGYQLAESLRERGNYDSTPMIAVTGYTEYDDRGRSLRAGFNAHMTKPINPSQLLQLIGEFLH